MFDGGSAMVRQKMIHSFRCLMVIATLLLLGTLLAPTDLVGSRGAALRRSVGSCCEGDPCCSAASIDLATQWGDSDPSDPPLDLTASTHTCWVIATVTDINSNV